MTVFNLPDLGEGLPDAEIVKWWVEEGAEVKVDQILGEVSTAKATVEVPSPFEGRIVKLHGQPGDVIDTGDPLVTFALEGEEIHIQDAEPAKTEHAEPETAAATGAAVFKMPDLGEGLKEAEILQWMIAEGDELKLGDTMVEVSTEKAAVEIPAPFDGTVIKLHGQAGDIVETGAPLIEIAGADAPGVAAPAPGKTPKIVAIEEDPGTVVGAIAVGDEITSEAALSAGGVVASPAVHAMARKLKIDIADVGGSGRDGAITLKDVRAAASVAAALGDAAVPAVADQASVAKIGPAARAKAQALGVDVGAIRASGPKGVITKEDVLGAARHGGADAGPRPPATAREVKAVPRIRAYAKQAGIDIASVSPSGFLGIVTIADIDRAIAEAGAPAQAFVPLQAYRRPKRETALTGEPERIIGPRRAMAVAMSKAHAEVALTSIFDEADITAWPQGTDITLRVVRAIVAASIVEPALNAWFDGKAMERTLHKHVNLGVAVDSPHGLFVPVIKNADAIEPDQIRAELDRLRAVIADQSIKPTDMSGATITLSNFGMIAGRFATPVVSPPEVAIIGIGGLFNQLVMTGLGIENRRFIPISLTFDHRACTGGDTARFLAALLRDLSLSH